MTARDPASDMSSAGRYTSQHGEDCLLEDHFSGKHGGVFVELGALDGISISNSWYFERYLGWTGVLVEAHPEQAELCRKNRPNSQVIHAAAVAPGRPQTVSLQIARELEAFSSLASGAKRNELLSARSSFINTITVPARTLSDILESAGLVAIDFLSLDVEGAEWEVLKGLDLRRWSPAVLLIESNSNAPDPRIALRLFRAGYARKRRIVINDWFERASRHEALVSLLASWIEALPDLGKLCAREALRQFGVLEAVRRIRASCRMGTPRRLPLGIRMRRGNR